MNLTTSARVIPGAVDVALLGSNTSQPCYSNTLKPTCTPYLFQKHLQWLHSLHFRIILKGGQNWGQNRNWRAFLIQKATCPNSKCSFRFSSRLLVLDYTGLGSTIIHPSASDATEVDCKATHLAITLVHLHGRNQTWNRPNCSGTARATFLCHPRTTCSSESCVIFASGIFRGFN